MTAYFPVGHDRTSMATPGNCWACAFPAMASQKVFSARLVFWGLGGLFFKAVWKIKALKHLRPSQTNGDRCSVINNLIQTIWSPSLFWSLQASHLQDLGTNIAPPLACVGRFDAAVAADAQLTLLAEISTVKDQAQSLQAAGALSLPQLLGPTGTFSFDLQQLIFQLPVGQKEENVKG